MRLAGHQCRYPLADSWQRVAESILRASERAGLGAASARRREEFVAGRLSAKHAVAAALEVEPSDAFLLAVEVDGTGPWPRVRLHGPAAERAAQRGVRIASLSISHSGTVACAVALAVAAAPPPPQRSGSIAPTKVGSGTSVTP